MAANHNGNIRDSLVLYKWEKDTGGSSASYDERVLRGFQKVPKVICERYDIKPYLVKMGQDLPPDLSKPTFVALHDICNYDKKCSVRLKRENLEQLKEVFMRKDQALIKSFKCNICQKVYLSEKILLNHQQNKHIICYEPQKKIPKRVSFSDAIIVHEVKEYHKCRKCPKIYEDYDSLKIHMRDVHQKRRCYTCFYCSQDFVNRMFFKVHVKLHCDACGLLLDDKKSYSEHRRNVCKIIKKYECKTCHISLFYFMDLKDHSYEHMGSFYICDICKDRFDDKCALAHHITFLHSKKRPKNLYTTQMLGDKTVYVCKFCDVSSVEREFIEKHVSTFPEYEKCAMTGYKDFYFCEQCFEKFSTETDMLQHKWSHFLETAQQNEAALPEPVHTVNLLNMENLTVNAPQTIDSENVENLTDTTTQNTETTHITTRNTETVEVQKPLKTVYNIKTEKLPPLLQPRILVEKLVFPNEPILEKPKLVFPNEPILEKPKLVFPNEPILEKPKLVFPNEPILEKPLTPEINTNAAPTSVIDLTNLDENIQNKPTIVEKRKTLLSKHQCELCFKYLSTNCSLTRHMYSIHGISRNGYVPPVKKANFHCKDCEEDFALPSLLKNHNCIRINLPEPPFQDARPEIQLDTSLFNQQLGFDDLDFNNDYMNVDFDIPAPIVELTEYDNVSLVLNDDVTGNNDRPLNTVTVHNNRQLNNVTVPNDRQFNNAAAVNNDKQMNSLVNNNMQLARLLNNPTVHYDRQLNNVVNNNRQFTGQLNNTMVNRQFNNATSNNRQSPYVNNHRQLTGQLSNMLINNNRQFNNATVNNGRQLQNMVNNHRQLTGRLNNDAFNSNRQLNGPLNNLVYNDRPLNGQLNNVQSNLHNGKQTNSNLRYIVVQEVPIEF